MLEDSRKRAKSREQGVGNNIHLVRVPVDANILDEGMGLELGLDLAEGDVLAQLQLDQVLLPVHDPDSPVLEHLGDVSGAEPPLAALVIEVLLRLLVILVVTPGYTGTAWDEKGDED